MPSPAPVTNTLADRVSSLLNSPEINAFVLERLVTEVKQVISNARDSSIVGSAYSVLGALMFIQGKYDEGRACFENAIKLHAGRSARENYGMSLASALFFEEAFEVSSSLADDYPDDVPMLVEAHRAAFWTLDFDAAEKLMGEILKRQDFKLSVNDEDTWGRVQLFAAALKERGISVAEVRNILNTAAAVVREAHKHAMGTYISVSRRGEVLLQVSVRGTVDEIADTNMRIANTLVLKYDEVYSDLLSIACNKGI